MSLLADCFSMETLEGNSLGKLLRMFNRFPEELAHQLL
jgi:hypothetical protein